MKKLIFILSLIALTSCNAVSNNNGTVNQNQNFETDDDIINIGQALKSQMNRENGSEVVTQRSIMDKSKEVKRLFTPEGYSEIPSSMTMESLATKTVLSNYNQECGNLIGKTSTLGDRIADCRKVYLNRNVDTRWHNKSHGVAGEGNWSLVSVSIDISKTPAVTSTVWYDFTTKLIWSDLITETDFAKAATAYNRTCSLFSENNRHKLNSDYVIWRLPTRGDYLQADLNGARYILNNTDKDFWTSTLISTDSAWSIKQSTGNSTLRALTEVLPVRCVGTEIL